MSLFTQVQGQLRSRPGTWLVTGAAGFIGSHLVEHLLRLDQNVIGLDDFSTGHRRNLSEVQSTASAAQWSRFRLVEGDIGDLALCRRACAGVDFVLHHAALGSVPQSIEDPLRTHAANVRGTLHVLQAARENGVKRFVFASSSAVYGDQPGDSMTEDCIGRALSPYAASKRMNEIDADVFARCYGLASAGLRYFNVFGPRQDPKGAYAAVIPRWISALLKNEPVEIFGDGGTTRDFCYVENVVQANLLAATAPQPGAAYQVFNIACGASTSLNQLFGTLRELLAKRDPGIAKRQPVYRDFRSGDVRHSLADVSRAREQLSYAPTHSVAQGLQTALDWYQKRDH